MILGIESFLNYYLFLSRRRQLSPAVDTYNRDTFEIPIPVPFLIFDDKYH
jgi:hypothetical protein